MEEKVRRAEEDKAMALTALEEREREFLQEKDTVRRATGAVWRGGRNDWQHVQSRRRTSSTAS